MSPTFNPTPVVPPLAKKLLLFFPEFGGTPPIPNPFAFQGKKSPKRAINGFWLLNKA